MPHGTVIEVITARSAAVFELLHNYERRLEWDTLLQRAYLTDGHRSAGLGATYVSQGRAFLGGIGVKTEYVSFKPPLVAAVKMINRPPFFDSFAATIRHADLPDGTSTVEYIYTFTARPAWLRFVLHPIMRVVFSLETRKRLRALKNFFLTHRQTPDVQQVAVQEQGRAIESSRPSG